ncbi:uncharacterized protein LOC130686413 isoform X2 [Daphnia carinata]|uniref:uncharacterized protein LOC130686413 isoform X2 n=1 Tax=Daphnia carinata TaxID=120202 RepID=UPI00257DFB6A|nr:uncharacterized protein LOC130686413 isoform X2 [Daphnia carinata]
MKLEHWKLEAVEVQDAEELFWPTSPTRYYTIPRSTQKLAPHMDKQRSPTPLQELALEAFLLQLKNLCQQKNYTENKRALKHYLKFQLPASIRQQLLAASTKDSRIYTLLDLSMFELLLSTSVKHVYVQSVRTFFRQSFVTSLRQLGTGLEELTIHDSSWLQHREYLPSAFARMTHLRRISLRYLANDQMIAAIAQNCLHLQEMDVSYSIDVTDCGMKFLCDPTLILTSMPQPKTSECERKSEQRCRKISAPSAPSRYASGCMVWFPRFLARGIKRYSVHDEKKLNNHESPAHQSQEDISPQWPEDELSLNVEIPSTCVKSLCRLEILGTSITPVGVKLVAATSSIIIIVY